MCPIGYESPWGRSRTCSRDLEHARESLSTGLGTWPGPVAVIGRLMDGGLDGWMTGWPKEYLYQIGYMDSCMLRQETGLVKVVRVVPCPHNQLILHSPLCIFNKDLNIFILILWIFLVTSHQSTWVPFEILHFFNSYYFFHYFKPSLFHKYRRYPHEVQSMFKIC